MIVRLGAVSMCLLAFAGIAAVGAMADIGIRSLTPTAASPGDKVRLTVSGYLGPKPWRPMPVVMVPASAAPKPYPCRAGFCTPRLYASQLRQSPYRLLGILSKWRVRRPGDESGSATFTFSVPELRPGRYVFGLFCATCAAGPRGSIIIDARLSLTVRP